MSDKTYIPNVSQDELHKWYKKILIVMHMRPMRITIVEIDEYGRAKALEERQSDAKKMPTRDNTGTLCYIKKTGPKKIFTFIPEAEGDATGLVCFEEIITYHELPRTQLGTLPLFAPTAEEVLAQIPNKYIDQTVAFEVLWPKDDPTEMSDEERTALQDGYHRTTTRLYTRAN